MLNGDEFRSGISQDLAFDVDNRAENVKRTANGAKILLRQGSAVICALITPLEQHRAIIKAIPGNCVSLIFIDCSNAVCDRRDVKGPYQDASHQHLNMKA